MAENGERNGSGLLRWIVGLLVGVLLALIGNLVSGVRWGATLSADVRNLIDRVEAVDNRQELLDLKFQGLDKQFAVFRAVANQKGARDDSMNP